MRHLLFTLFLLAPGLAMAAEVDLKTVQAAGTKDKKYGPYVGVFGGQTTSQEGTMKLDTGKTLNYDLLDQENDFIIGVEVGYNWRTRFYVELGLEFEALFGSTQVEGVYDSVANEGDPVELPDVATAAADMNYAAFMINTTLALDLRKLQPYLGSFIPRFRPYIGAGIGGAQIWFRNQKVQSVGDLAGSPTAPSASPFNLDQFVFAYQIFGGIEFSVNKRLSFYTEYRRLSFEKTEELSSFETEMMLGGLRLRY